MIDQCPCGRARAGCVYHDPALQTETRQFAVRPGAPFKWPCGCERQRGQRTHMHGFSGWLLTAEDAALLDGAPAEPSED